MRRGRDRPRAGHRHRDRLHRVHHAADARRRHAAVRAAAARRPPARLREAVEAPRRPAPGRPHQRARGASAASRGCRATAAGSPRSGSSPRPCSCSRRTREIYAPDGSLGRGRRLDRLAARAAATSATPAPPATRASIRTAPTRRADFLAALNPAFAGFVADKLDQPIGQLGARAGALTARPPAWTGLPEGIAVAVGNVDAHVTAPAAQAVEPGQMVAIMGTSTCHVMIADVLREVPGHVRRRRRRHRRRRWGYEAGQSGVGDIFGWFVDTGVPAAYGEEAATAPGVDIHELPDRARRRPGDRGARPGGAGLAQRQPLGARRPRAVRRRRRA